MAEILVVAENHEGAVSDASRELVAKAREIASAGGHTVGLVAFGDGMRDSLRTLDVDHAIVVSGESVGAYHPEVYEKALLAVWDDVKPGLVLLSNTTMGMDLGAALAAHRNVPMVAYCTSLTPDGEGCLATSQVYGGKLNAEVEVPLSGTVLTAIPGSWPASEATGTPSVRDMAAPSASALTLTRVIEAESGQDVDITKADILVSVGRGIEDPDNLELADALAEALGGVVSCSRPVVDAGWLPRSRQVGKSGQTVKPKVYLALGISGAPEHLQGMKDAEFIIAVNSDERAPIFEVAHYGGTADILDLMPALTEKLQGRAG